MLSPPGKPYTLPPTGQLVGMGSTNISQRSWQSWVISSSRRAVCHLKGKYGEKEESGLFPFSFPPLPSKLVYPSRVSSDPPFCLPLVKQEIHRTLNPTKQTKEAQLQGPKDTTSLPPSPVRPSRESHPFCRASLPHPGSISIFLAWPLPLPVLYVWEEEEVAISRVSY